ncbi:MAG: 30S ribosomal protein S12 methylthiotransferase RimO [Bacteroidia bacterium]|nr:30S ribosomal protein S12 methylthiotransferase RimO [Bacteroidia bacterium]
MKTKTIKRNKINVVTLGCSKNLVDSETLMAQLRAGKFEVTHDGDTDEAPVVVINTCGFIESAKQQSIDTILHYTEAKAKGLVKKVYVTGCLSERYKPQLEKEIPDVDAYFGTRDMPRLLKTLKANYKQELVGERLLATPSHYAYLKISEGCDRKCSFCAIPIMRGGHISVPADALVHQTEKLVSQGVKEIILIAQDLTFYGLDIDKKRTLAQLIRKLSAVKGIEWIRLHYAFPSGFPMDVADAINDCSNVCRYLDMPLQHGSDNMLRAMRRGITREKSTRLIEKLREKIPGVAIRTTFLVGYPGETDKDFKELLNWVQSLRFERLGVFTYSHEENTHAYLSTDNVPEQVKKERAAQLMEAQRSISRQLNKDKTGRKLKVLFDRTEGGYYIGRTEHDSPEVDNEVLVKLSGSDTGGRKKINQGEFSDVIITSADDYDLYGIIPD